MRLVLALALTACSSASAPDPTPGSGSAAITPIPKTLDRPRTTTRPLEVKSIHLDEPAIELPRQDAFVLIAPGKAPLQTLRYKLAPATTTYKSETRMASRHVGADSAWTRAVQVPTIVDGLTITAQPAVLQILPLPVELGGPATADSDQYTQRWMQSVANHRANVAIDERGNVGKVAFADDPGGARTGEAKDLLAQRLLAGVVPLPDKPVGAGASWKVVTILRIGGAFVKQTAIYTLASADARAWKIDAAITRIAEEQRVENAQLPAGAYVDLVALLQKLTGTLTIDPARPLGTGVLAVEARMHARIMGAGGPPTGIDQLVDDTGTVTFAAPI